MATTQIELSLKTEADLWCKKN